MRISIILVSHRWASIRSSFFESASLSHLDSFIDQQMLKEGKVLRAILFPQLSLPRIFSPATFSALTYAIEEEDLLRSKVSHYSRLKSPQIDGGFAVLFPYPISNCKSESFCGIAKRHLHYQRICLSKRKAWKRDPIKKEKKERGFPFPT